MYKYACVLLVIFLSCKTNTDPISTTSDSIIFSQEYYNNFNYHISLYSNHGTVLIKKSISNTSLFINDVNVFTDSNITANKDVPYSYLFNIDTLPININELLEFSWTNDNKEYNNIIKMVDEILIDFPVFNTNEDYILNWHIANNPNNFLIKLQIQDSTDTNILLKEWQVPGIQRSFKISKSYFDNLHIAFVNIVLIAFNYEENDDFLLITHKNKNDVYVLTN